MTDYCEADVVTSALDLRNDDGQLDTVITQCSRFIDLTCGRQFGPAANDTATTRLFDPISLYCVRIDDAYAVTLVETDGGAGTYTTDWASTDWQAFPLNGVGPDQQTGWPYTRIESIAGRTFTYLPNRPPLVRVTAKWGWAAVPDAVALACQLLVGEVFKAAREAPFGSAGMADFGPVTIRGNRRVDQLLAPYKTSTAAGGAFLVA
jgi:hypothetical protein